MAPGLAMEALGRIAFEVVRMRPLLPTYLHLLLSALFPIYTAAHASLSRPSSAAPSKNTTKDEDDQSDDDIEVVQQLEGLSPSDAITFPLLAGVTLASLYFLLQWLKDPAILNKILAVYFSQMGLFFGAKFLKDILSTTRSFLFPTQYSIGDTVWKVNMEEKCYTAHLSNTVKQLDSPLPGVLRNVPLPKGLSATLWKLRKLLHAKAALCFHIHKIVTIRTPVDVLDLSGFVLSSGIVAWHLFISKPWYLTNFMGFSFCYGSLQYITPTTGWTGTLVLCALFLYDIYFVFFTPMMVTVATKLDVPIKLLFPRPDGCVMPVGATEGSAAMKEYLECLARKRTMAMLGLGDIVVPGMMLAFALRFDLYIFYLRLKTSKSKKSTGALNTDREKKPRYVSAIGGWGERFWTSRKHQSAELKAKDFPKPYFHASIFGYLAGMVSTVVVMQIAEHAQPALLYLVPGVLLSMWSTAFFKGDLELLWNYTEAPEESANLKESADQSEKDEENLIKEIPKNKEVEDADTPGENLLPGNGAEAKVPEKSNKSSTEDTRRHQLICFEIILPGGSHTIISKDPDSGPQANGHASKSKLNSSAIGKHDEEELSDIKADHEVLEKLR